MIRGLIKVNINKLTKILLHAKNIHDRKRSS